MTLDTTIAGATADSYITVAWAIAYAGTRDMGPEADKWLDPATEIAQHERALRRATSDIDAYVRTGYPRYSATQALRFPRSVDVDAADAAIILEEIRRATYHQAVYVLANATVIDRASSRHARNAASASEPNIQYTMVSPDRGISVMSPRALPFLSDFSVAARPITGTLSSSRIASGFPGVSS